jgi:RNA polymerase sigma-70 factor (ECF subfamily)
LIRVFQSLPRFEPRHAGAFRDYVWTTMWNAVRDLARKCQRRGPSDPIDSHELATGEPSPLEQAIGSEALDRYDVAMERLRPEDREAIIMRIELGLSHAEIAEALGKPTAAAAHMAVSRALVRLAQEMAHAHVQPR